MTNSAKALMKTLADIPALVDPTSAQVDSILKLLDEEGFQALYGMLVAERQGYMEQLVMLPLGTASADALAAVTQGQIRGLARIGQSIVDIVQDKSDPETEESENYND